MVINAHTTISNISKAHNDKETTYFQDSRVLNLAYCLLGEGGYSLKYRVRVYAALKTPFSRPPSDCLQTQVSSFHFSRSYFYPKLLIFRNFQLQDLKISKESVKKSLNLKIGPNFSSQRLHCVKKFGSKWKLSAPNPNHFTGHNTETCMGHSFECWRNKCHTKLAPIGMNTIYGIG